MIRFGIIALILCSLVSCRVLFGDPVAKCCMFNTVSAVVRMDCSGQKINAVSVTIVADKPGEPGVEYYKASFNEAVSEAAIPQPPDSITHNRRIIVRVWTQTYVISDYEIDVAPADWLQKKTVYSTINAR